MFKRYSKNPILSAETIPYAASLIFNAGVNFYRGRYVMLFRNDYGLSCEDFQAGKSCRSDGPQFLTNLGVAWSDDGYHWTPEPEPCWEWCDEEVYRIYDPRLTVVEDELIVTFATDTRHGIRGGVATTRDLKHFEVKSMTAPDNRNMVIFPEKIGGLYWRLERPFPVYGQHGRQAFDLWASASPDLRYWGDTELVLAVEDVPFANDKIGPAAPPIKTERGWLTTFHSVWRDDAMHYGGWEERWSKRYDTGLMLLDLEDPRKVLAYTREPILEPETPEELDGFRGHVIFPGGMILEEDGSVKLYYGAADTVVCLAEAQLDDLWQHLAPVGDELTRLPSRLPCS